MEKKEEEKSLNDQLIEAAGNQDLDLAKELISRGAEASYVCKKDGTWGAYEQYTALHRAINGSKDEEEDTEENTEKRRELILLLLKNGADPNTTRDSYDWRGCGSQLSAFELLGHGGGQSPDPDILTAFINAGLNPNTCRTQNIHSMRTDGHIKTYLLHDMVKEGSVDCAIALLNAGADVEAKASESINNERGYSQQKSETALHVAVSANQLDMCLLLLAKGADINAIENHFDSHSDQDIVAENEELCGDNPRDDAYENPWTHTLVRCTPLHLAIEKGEENNMDIITVLLACDADPSIACQKGSTDSISSLDLMVCLKNDNEVWRRRSGGEDVIEDTSAEALKSCIENALKGELDVAALIKTLPEKTKDEILKTLDKIKELGWNFNTCNLPVIYETLKSVRTSSESQ